MFIQGKVTCCYKCEERTVGCHGTCERYLNQVKEHQEESERIRKAKEERRQFESYYKDKKTRKMHNQKMRTKVGR